MYHKSINNLEKRKPVSNWTESPRVSRAVNLWHDSSLIIFLLLYFPVINFSIREEMLNVNLSWSYQLIWLKLIFSIDSIQSSEEVKSKKEIRQRSKKEKENKRKYLFFFEGKFKSREKELRKEKEEKLFVAYVMKMPCFKNSFSYFYSTIFSFFFSYIFCHHCKTLFIIYFMCVYMEEMRIFLFYKLELREKIYIYVAIAIDIDVNIGLKFKTQRKLFSRGSHRLSLI